MKVTLRERALFDFNRRHFIGLLAAGVAMPCAAYASAPRREVRDDLAKHFVDDGTTGTFAAFRSDDGLIVLSDRERSGRALLPASTFKIANSVIALETGVVQDPDKDIFKWDGVTRSIAAWNRDHTLRSAMAASAVPVYQEIARRIGAERMQKYLDAFDYGNRNIGGGIDRFWLTGDLRIDPAQQIRFVDQLRRGTLPVSPRSQQLVREIMPVTQAGDAVIRAKTGLIGIDDRSSSGATDNAVGWLVGWAEKGGVQTVFALNLDVREPRHAASRMMLAQQCLRDIGAI